MELEKQFLEYIKNYIDNFLFEIITSDYENNGDVPATSDLISNYNYDIKEGIYNDKLVYFIDEEAHIIQLSNSYIIDCILSYLRRYDEDNYKIYESKFEDDDNNGFDIMFDLLLNNDDIINNELDIERIFYMTEIEKRNLKISKLKNNIK